ncbi:UNVERIFIED_CONTAM: hypothetical protein ABIC26_000074 [Paenibacillus sp. PvR008]
MSNATDSVDLNGPPFVSAKFNSNTLKGQDIARNRQTVTLA